MSVTFWASVRATLVATLVAAPPAFGGQNLAVSPFGCQPRTADQSKVDFAFDKGIFNNSTTAAARVFCPITTIEQRGGNDTSRRAIIWVIDNNSAVDFKCNVVLIINAGGSSGSFGTFPLVKELVSGNTARYAAANFGLNPPVGYDSAHINCTIPAKTSAGTSSIMNLFWITS